MTYLLELIDLSEDSAAIQRAMLVMWLQSLRLGFGSWVWGLGDTFRA
jgi:hypothetical protein